MSTRNTVVLIGNLADQHDERRAAAATAIKPGMLIQPTATDEVVVHATAGGEWALAVAKEDNFQGKTLTDAYAPGDVVFIHRCQPNDLIQVILPAGAAAVLMTDWLTSNGDGKVKKAAGADVKLFRPGEAIDNSAGGTDVFIKAYVRG